MKITRKELLQIMAPLSIGAIIIGCNTQIPKKIEKEDHWKDQDLEAIEQELSMEGMLLLLADNPDFNKYNHPFNLNVVKMPNCIALCINTLGISNAVKYALKHHLEIGVKSGGHCFENFSTIQGGLTINLSMMKNIVIAKDKRTSWIESGCLLKDTYDILLPQGKIVPAGSCATVGIGGLALGGGYGFFSRKYGLTCDHILEVEMIKPNGEIVIIDDKHELMWALKGAGNGNFGMVSKFKFLLRDAPATFSRWRFKAYKLDVERYKSLLKAWLLLTEKLPQSMFGAFVLNKKTAVFLFTDFEQNSSVQILLNEFGESCDKTDVKLTKPTAEALRNYYGIQNSIYFKNSSAGYFNTFADFEPFIDEVAQKVIHSKGLIYQINTLGGAIDSADFAEKSVYPHRSFNYLTELQAYWENETQGTTLINQNNEILALLETKGVNRQYVNYPSLAFKNPLSAYYGIENTERLKALKLKYDKNNLLNRLQGLS